MVIDGKRLLMSWRKTDTGNKKPHPPSPVMAYPPDKLAQTKRLLNFDRMPCGCSTWKHEGKTDLCFPMAEQELAGWLGFC